MGDEDRGRIEVESEPTSPWTTPAGGDFSMTTTGEDWMATDTRSS